MYSMPYKTDFADLETFIAIARAGGFRKAAALRGVSGSALSHAMRGLESRLGVRLFHRTSRSVSLTAAGEMLLEELEPSFEGIRSAVDKLERFGVGPAGLVRLTVLRDAAHLLLAPRLAGFAAQYPEVEIEVDVDDSFVDMVAEGFDAGIRYGGTVPEGMIASRLTPELEWVAVASPTYLAEHGTPIVAEDLAQHRCIRIRTGTERIYHWEFVKDDHEVRIDVPGSIMLGDSELSIKLAQAGAGIFYGLRDRLADQLAEGSLEVVLADWAYTTLGFHAYYVSHRQVPSALRALLDHLKTPVR